MSHWINAVLFSKNNLIYIHKEESAGSRSSWTGVGFDFTPVKMACFNLSTCFYVCFF